MGQRIIYTDDLTDREITADAATFHVWLTLEISEATDDAAKVEFKTDRLDVSALTAESLQILVEKHDLAGMIAALRPVVSGKVNADSEKIRAWVKDKHPEITVKERGALPVEAMAAYRREVLHTS